MDKNALIEKAKELIAAPMCYQGLKDAAQNWIDAIGTDGETTAANALLVRLEEDVTSIDGLIGFCSSPAGKKVFGEEQAEKMGAAAEKAKASGAKYCICAACTAGGVILDHKKIIL